ncbi:MAG: GTP 3',8-cyclase MoaA [Deltaproteobacteria bacterium]|nr:GTP 3',8-cyclase MoaA [Deltaproteobacteria bacterium]
MSSILFSTGMQKTQIFQKSSALSDRFGRRIDYLRISITDRCNLRCIYCMPPEGIELFEKNQILTFEEMERFSRIAVNLGVRKIKLTGGEPLVRKGIMRFIASLKEIDGLDDLSLTTNGIFLEDLADDLKASGLNRVNVSLDSLDNKRYGEMTRGGDLSRVLRGINKALEVGFIVKINTVVLDGLIEREILKLIEFGKERNIEVRFIEFMPLCGNGWKRNYFIPLVDTKKKIGQRYKLTPLGNNGVADRYGIDGGGIIGFITPVSEPFCSHCSRLRLIARGTLRPCLFSSLEINIFPLLRNQASHEEIEKFIQKAVYMKPEWNPVLRGVEDPKKVFIRNIGG